MRADIQTYLSELERRVRALKSNRPVHLNQIAMLQQPLSARMTLASGSVAQFEVSIVCAGPPLADVSYLGFSSVGSGIIVSNTSWSISGNNATALCEFYNTGATTQTADITITAWALNGLSATIRRIA